MNKKTGFKPSTLIVMIYVICAFFLGTTFGVAMSLSSAAFLLQQINIDNIDISFNESKAINAFYDRAIADGLKPGWIDIETKDKIVETYPVKRINVINYSWSDDENKKIGDYWYKVINGTIKYKFSPENNTWYQCKGWFGTLENQPAGCW